jgi:hypothetical protein
MTRSSFPLKTLIITLFLFASLYLSRHYLLAVCFESLLSRVSNEKLEFQKRTWEEGSLIYEQVVFGSQLSAYQLKVTPELQLSPLHISVEVHLTEPHLELFSENATPVNLAFLVPNKWVTTKLDIERGTLSIDHESVGMIDLLSSTEPDSLGTLILSQEEVGAYCTCDASYSDGRFFYSLKCESAPVLTLYSVMHLFSWNPRVELQGGRIDADLKGTFTSLQGELTGYDLQMATSQGELDFKQLRLQGKWDTQTSIEGSFEGGRFKADAALIEDARSHFCFEPKKSSTILLNGKLCFGEIQEPFHCQTLGQEGLLAIAGLEIPFSFESCDQIIDVKIKEFACNSYRYEASVKASIDKVEGEISAIAPLSKWSQEWIQIEELAQFKALFRLQNYKIDWRGIGTVFNDQVYASGLLDLKTFKWNTVFESSSTHLSHYSSLFSEGILTFKGQADSSSTQITCQGEDLVLQTETELLQVPGKTQELKLDYSFLSKKLFAEINLSPSTLHLKAFSTPIHLENGALSWKEGVLEIKNLQGSCSEEIVFHFPHILHNETSTLFLVQFPSEDIEAEGKWDQHVFTLKHLQAGASKITSPLCISFQNESWEMEMGAFLELESLNHYVRLAQSIGLFKQAHFPTMHGTLNVSGLITPEKASLDVVSDGCSIGSLTLPALQGHITKEDNRLETDSLLIGDLQLKGSALYDHNQWLFPKWRALYHELELQGSGELNQTNCSIKAEGIYNDIALQAAISWDLEKQIGNNCFLTLEKEGLQIHLRTQDLQYKDGKLEANVQTTASHLKLKDPFIAQLSASWTPERIIFQGPFTQGSYENDHFKLEAREIHALYEKGILNFQSKLQLNKAPLIAKGSFIESGRGVVHLFEGDHQLKVSFNSFSDIGGIEGKIFGIDCNLIKKGTLFEGKVKIESSAPLAALLQKPALEQFANLEFNGLVTDKSLKGTITGSQATIKGYILDQIHASIDYNPTRFEIRALKIEDAAGQLTFKECIGMRSHTLKPWEISIPHLRGQQIQPSLVRQVGETLKEPKPFQIRQLTLTGISGILGRPLSFTGQGFFYFTQKEKRDPSLFDLPRAFLKDWGLDLSLLSPARGSVNIELKQGKVLLRSLKDAYSDGEHSEFYLSENEPSYFDFSGGLFLNLRMKQNVILKIAEPFTLSVRGTWQKPFYTLR